MTKKLGPHWVCTVWPKIVWVQSWVPSSVARRRIWTITSTTMSTTTTTSTGTSSSPGLLLNLFHP